MARRKTQPAEGEVNDFNPENFDQTPSEVVEAVAEAMKMPEEPGQDAPQAEAVRTREPRGWTRRNAPESVSYRRFNAVDKSGEMQIFFKVVLPKGQDKPSEEMLDVFRRHKKSLDGYPTGLEFDKKDFKYGAVWKMPLNKLTAGIADSMDHELEKLANKIESAQGAER